MHIKTTRIFSVRLFTCVLATAVVFLAAACETGRILDSEEAQERLDSFSS